MVEQMDIFGKSEQKKKEEVYHSRVYTDRPPYADFEAPRKFLAIQSIIAKRLTEHPNAICSYSGGSDSDIFAEKNKFQTIRGWEYKNIRDFIVEKKTDDQTFLISPVDAVEETAAQISYKSGTEITRTLRASKCEVAPCPTDLAQDFFIRNHRQTAPLVRDTSVCFGLVFKNELVAVMLYDVSNGAVRGRKKDYELVRLSISKGTRIHGGASKLQSACEDTLRQMGVTKIYSYSNATINSGAVYEKLGFRGTKVDGGQPFVVLKNNRITRLINLYPRSTDRELALHGWLKVHLGGNKTWRKDI